MKIHQMVYTQWHEKCEACHLTKESEWLGTAGALTVKEEVYFANESHCYLSANKQSSNTLRDQNSLILPSKLNSEHLSGFVRRPVEEARSAFRRCIAYRFQVYRSILEQRFMKCI